MESVDVAAPAADPAVPPAPAGYAAYREELIAEHMPAATASAVRMGVILQNLFLALDYMAFPELFAEFFAVRMAINVGFAACYAARNRLPRTAMIGSAYALGLGMLALIFAEGATTLPYYTGLILVFFGVGVMLPFTAVEALAVSGGLAGLFGTLVWLGPATVGPVDPFATFFVLGAAAETVFCSAFLDRMRFRDFVQRAEIEAARNELALLDDAKTRFTANVHHELRTPLTLMLAPLEGIRAGDYGSLIDEVRRPLRTMHVNGKRLLKLINNLLDLAKLESAQFEVTRAPVDIQDLLVEVVEGAVPMAERKQLELFMDPASENPVLFADASALDKVLVNLVGNALKFTEAGGEIGVGARAVEDGVEVWVRDTGVGLAPDQLARVFDRFAQVDGSVTRRHEGTGIGLSLAHELVGLHGGRIWAESPGLGQGATMRFFLPTGEADASSAGVEDAILSDAPRPTSAIASVEAELGFVTSAVPAEGEDRYVEFERSAEKWQQRQGDSKPLLPEDLRDDDRPSILVVDDNADMRELITFILGTDFRVHAARDGREALALLPAIHPDLIVSDIMMPEMSGTELCEAVKSDDEWRDTPVMLVSSKGEDEMKVEGLERGADDYVTKPFHPRELLARARSHVSLRVARRDLAARNAEVERALGELQRAEAQLVQSERLAAVGELAAGIAHEVNNPVNYALNAVRTLATQAGELGAVTQQIAALDFDDPEKLLAEAPRVRDRVVAAGAEELGDIVDELAEIAIEGLERTQHLVGDLRDFAAPGDGPVESVDVEEGLRSTSQLMRHDLEVANTHVVLRLPKPMPRVRGNAANLRQIFLNLIKNAADAMGAGGEGTIEVSAEVRDGRLALAFQDDGPGVPPDVAGRLFEPFFTTKPAGQGTGLGLSMCRKIASAHGGELELVDRSGSGACFLLTLPIDDNPEVSR